MHRITVESVRRDVAREAVPRMLAGARACPPEDCGGSRGYDELLDAMADPEHEEHEAMLEWLGGPHHPEDYDVGAHDRELARWRRQWTPARKATQQRRTAVGSGIGRGVSSSDGRGVSSSDGRAVGRGNRRTPPAMLRAAEVLALLDGVRHQPPGLPEDIVDAAADLLRRFAGSKPNEFLGVRRPELWLAAAVHAAYMLYPRSLLYPHRPLTLAELSELCGVSSASISKRSRQLR